MGDQFTTITWVQGTTVEHEFAGLTIDPNWTRIVLHVKVDPTDHAGASVLRVVVSNPPNAEVDGLQIIERMTPATAGVTIDDAALEVEEGDVDPPTPGSVTLTLSSEASAVIVPRRWLYWRVEQETATGAQRLDAGDQLTVEPGAVA